MLGSGAQGWVFLMGASRTFGLDRSHRPVEVGGDRMASREADRMGWQRSTAALAAALLAITAVAAQAAQLPEGAVMAFAGLSPDGQRAVVATRNRAVCWQLAVLDVSTEGAWPVREIDGTSGGGECSPLTAAVDGGFSRALVYDYHRGEATLVPLDGASSRGTLRLAAEPSYRLPPPAAAALSADGRFALLGAPSYACKVNVPQTRCGLAALFAEEAGRWRQIEVFEFPEGGPFNIVFGQVAALSRGAEILAVGGSGENGDQGEVYLWEKRAGSFEPAGVLVPDSRGDWVFGTALAMAPDGRTIAVGADQAVYIFTRDARGWALATRLDAPEASAGTFGGAVALSADSQRLAVGAPRSACGELPRCGAVYLFERNGASGSSWRLITRMTPPTPRPTIDFGWRIALDQNGERALVQADRAYILDLP